MKGITVSDLNIFLLREACAHTRVWLEAMPKSHRSRRDLLRLLDKAQNLIPRIGDGSDVAKEARELARPIEMDGFGIGGIPQSSAALWPKQFDSKLRPENTRRAWMEWNLRSDTYYRLIVRVHQILRAIEAFDDPRTDISGSYAGRLMLGYHSRRALAQHLVTPDVRWFQDEINAKAIRQPTEVDWIWVENGEGAVYDDETLTHLAEVEYEQGLRGVWFARPPKENEDFTTLLKSASDMRLRYWLPNDPWEPEIARISLL